MSKLKGGKNWSQQASKFCEFMDPDVLFAFDTRHESSGQEFARSK